MVAGHGARLLAVFGTFRYILALLVAFGHIQFRFQGQWNWAGVYSAFGFFALSGFLMTRVLHQTYGYSPRGFAAALPLLHGIAVATHAGVPTMDGMFGLARPEGLFRIANLGERLAKLPAHCWKGRRTAPPGGPR